MITEDYINCYECKKGTLIHFKFAKWLKPPSHIFYCDNCDAIFPLGLITYTDENDKEWLERFYSYIVFHKLDEIEREVFLAIAANLTTINIAKKLDISDRYVRYILKSLLKEDYIREVSTSKTDPTKYYVINSDKYP